jgi:acetyl-CoA carboxylase alpha subunit
VVWEKAAAAGPGLQVTDRRAQMEDALYLPPPGIQASIIFRDASRSGGRTQTHGQDLKRIGSSPILPVPEEVTDLEGFASSIGKYLQKSIQELSRIKINKLVGQREKRALSFGLPKHQGKVHELKKMLERPFKKFFYKLPPHIQVVNFD